MMFVFNLVLAVLLGLPVAEMALEQVIVDTDPGTDDATALFLILGNPKLKVLAITNVRGNTDVPQVVRNTCYILRTANKYKIPVYSGSNSSLVESVKSDSYFGKYGFEGLRVVSEEEICAEKSHAAVFLARKVRENPGRITILAIGPLTNIALAIHLNPDFLLQAKEVIVLGGSINGRGNVAPGVEFNFYADPHAAKFVLDQASMMGAILTLVPLETVLDNQLPLEFRWKTLSNLDNKVVSLLNVLESRQNQRRPTSSYGPADVYAAAILLNSSFVTKTDRYYGFVEADGETLRGALTLDYINVTQKAPNLNVVLEVDTDVLKEEYLNSLSSYDSD